MSLNYDKMDLKETHKLIEALLGVVFVVTAKGKLLNVTPKYRRLFGYTDQEIEENIQGPDLFGSKDFGQQKIDQTLEQGHMEFETNFVTKSGEEIPHMLRTIAVTIGGEPCVAGTSFDISDRVKALDKLQEQHREIVHISRVAALGELATAFAHEINQPLAAIANNAKAAERLMNAKQSSEDLIQQILTDISSDARRAGDIIKHLRSLLKKEEENITSIDLNSNINKIVGLLKASVYKKDPVILVHLCSPPPIIKGVEIQIQQIAMNLITNAADAICNFDDRPHEVVVSTSYDNDDYAVISVYDNGQHLPDNILERVFDPFFSTKSNGLGMGLSISRSIIEAHQGSITVENCPKGGVEFSVRLPLSNE